MAIGDDDLENRMSAKHHHHRGIGSKGGDRTGFGPPPRPAPLVYGGDDALLSSSPQWTSWLVPMFVVANVIVFVVTMFVNNCPAHSHGPNRRCVATFLGRLSFEPLRNNPLFGPSSRTLDKLGSLEWDKVVEKHEGWRLLTCIWLHAGVIHLAANMLSLVFIGIRLEQQFGFVRIGVIYLLSGIGGSVLSSLFIRNSISVGASGALFGLLGSMLSELLTNWTIYSNKIAALLTLLFVIAINLAIGILPHVDNFAHVGGFLTGFLLGFVLLARPQFKWLARENMPQGRRLTSKYKPYQYLLWLLSLALLVLGFVMALVLLFKGEDGNDHCRWCRYLRCIPTSRWNCDDV
ncbi:RHOMBOID-like protein 3 isoform X1 [Brassica rapa]|uniref:RHOMBOID-like protein n=2 Tax=Brassica campestris TaxID=3711 RepID=M4CYI2_BRACM|nr:RHOMBOID-like protein 3 isoform X1 [Brassica rapa]